MRSLITNQQIDFIRDFLISHLSHAHFQSPPKGVTVPYTPLKAVTVAGLSNVGNLPTIFPTSQAILPNQTISQAQVGFDREI